MQRRDAIRLVGGGTLAATLPLLGACSTAPPLEAVAAWSQEPAETDPRRWALAHAILSPNSHNRQPWLVDLREPGAITLFVDRERLLPETDPWFRQIMVSQGTFLETLCIALAERGLAPQVQLFPQGEPGARTLDERPVARVTWPAVGTAMATKDPLFAQIRRRHTAKVGYDTSRAVEPATLARLRDAAAGPGAAPGPAVRFGGTVDAAALPPLRTLCIESARVELSTPRTVMESLRLTRVGPEEIARHRDGISVNGAFPRLMAALGLFDRSQPPAPGSSAFKAMFERFEEHSATAMGFVWLSTPVVAGATRAAEVAAGRAYQRLQLKATEIGLQVHPMSQAPQEFAEMAPFRDELQRRTIGRAADVEVVQMFCRIGYCAEQPRTPRRELASFVRA
jgi:nitroreductase